MKKYIFMLIISAFIFIILDALWLGMIAKNLYQENLGNLIRLNFNILPIIIFYCIYILGLFIFVLKPNINETSTTKVMLMGALFGLVTYATYDLTNYITLKDFPLNIVIIDLVWGTFLVFVTTTLTHLIHKRFIK